MNYWVEVTSLRTGGVRYYHRIFSDDRMIAIEQCKEYLYNKLGYDPNEFIFTIDEEIYQ